MSFTRAKNIGFALLIFILVMVGLIPSYVTNRIDSYNAVFFSKLNQLDLATKLQQYFWDASVGFSEQHNSSSNNFDDILVSLDKSIKILGILEKETQKSKSKVAQSELESLRKNVKRFKIAIIHYQKENDHDPSADNTIQMEHIALNAQKRANEEFTRFFTAKIDDVKTNQVLISESIKSGRLISIAGLLIGVTAGILAAVFVGRALSKPIQRLLEGTKNVANGDLSSRVDDRDSDEIGRLASSFNQMSQNLQTYIEKHETLSQNATKAAESEKKKSEELVSTVKKLNQEIVVRKSVQKQLIIAKQIAEKSNQAKSDFLANMSHELRTPLNHIIGFTELVLDKNFGDLTADQQEYLTDVLNSSQHLLSLINDILDLSKVEAGKLELQHTNVNLRMLLENSLNMVKEKALKCGIKLSNYLNGIPETIIADERKLKQIIYNLLSNAVKFTPDGGTVSLTAQKCKLDDAEFSDMENTNDSGIKITVTDTGIGINPNELNFIFNPFEQVETSKSRKFQGTGLGLSLTKSLVELHGGRVWAESEGEDKGSMFIFTLPITPINISSGSITENTSGE